MRERERDSLPHEGKRERQSAAQGKEKETVCCGREKGRDCLPRKEKRERQFAA